MLLFWIEIFGWFIFSIASSVNFIGKPFKPPSSFLSFTTLTSRKYYLQIPNRKLSDICCSLQWKNIMNLVWVISSNLHLNFIKGWLFPARWRMRNWTKYLNDTLLFNFSVPRRVETLLESFILSQLGHIVYKLELFLKSIGVNDLGQLFPIDYPIRIMKVNFTFHDQVYCEFLTKKALYSEWWYCDIH